MKALRIEGNGTESRTILTLTAASSPARSTFNRTSLPRSPRTFLETSSLDQSRACCRRAFDHRLNIHAVVMALDLNSNPIKAGGLIFFQLPEFRRREVNRMRVEGEEHSLDRCLSGLFVIYVAGVFLFHRRNCFVIIALDFVGFVLLSGRALI